MIYFFKLEEFWFWGDPDDLESWVGGFGTYADMMKKWGDK